MASLVGGMLFIMRLSISPPGSPKGRRINAGEQPVFGVFLRADEKFIHLDCFTSRPRMLLPSHPVSGSIVRWTIWVVLPRNCLLIPADKSGDRRSASLQKTVPADWRNLRGCEGCG